MEFIISSKFILIIIFIIILIALFIFARHLEKIEFNNGICKTCNKKLRLFDTDSQGGRGYICDSCKHTVWISYSVDKNFKEE